MCHLTLCKCLTIIPKYFDVNPLSANPTKWSNTLKNFVGNLPTNCLNVFDHLVGLAFKGIKTKESILQSVARNTIHSYLR